MKSVPGLLTQFSVASLYDLRVVAKRLDDFIDNC